MTERTEKRVQDQSLEEAEEPAVETSKGWWKREKKSVPSEGQERRRFGKAGLAGHIRHC